MLSDRIKGALLGAGMSEGHVAALAAAGYDEDEVFEAMSDRGAEALARHAKCAPGVAEKALLRLRPLTAAQVRGWSAAKMAAAAVEAALAGEVDWRGAVAARVFALTGGVVPRGMDPAVLERFLAYQMATEARGRVTPYTAPAFDGVLLVPWAEAAKKSEEGPLRDPFTGEVLDAAGHNPARDRDFPVTDEVAMGAIAYFAARAPKLDPNDEDDVHQAVHAALAAVACARGAKDGDLRSLIRGSAQIRPSIRSVAQEVAAAVLDPSGPEAAEVRVARERLRSPVVAVDEVGAQRAGRTYKDVERQVAALDECRAAPAPAPRGAKKVFVLASAEWPELKAHLMPSIRYGELTVVATVDCPGGAVMDRWIRGMADAANIVVWMVTAKSVVEFGSVVDDLHASKKRVVPVMVAPADIAGPVAGLVRLPSDGKPVTSHKDRDDAWVDVVRRIRKLL